MRRVASSFVLFLLVGFVGSAQAKPKIKYPGGTREAALRCPGAGCLGSVTTSPGEQVDFWIAGSDLAKVTSIKFQPSDGIQVGKLEATEDTVHAQLTISPGAALGKRSFVVSSPAGDSNQSNGELNITTFRISNLKIDNVANNNGTLTFRVTFNYSDPTGAVSSEGMDRNTSLNFTGQFIGGVGSGFKFNPEGRASGAKIGVISFTESYDNLRGTTGAIYSISLAAKDGRESDKLQTTF